MQRVSALLPSWERNKAAAPESKPKTISKVFSWATPKSPATSSPTTTKVGREVYWPTTLDRECEKAARILKSFCTDGFLAQDNIDSVPASPTAPVAPATPQQITKKIPPRIIQDAVGLAIFSCMRSGLWMSGSGGSGILIARKADGTWSPPSGIILHTAALGFVVGVDIYDCILVINSVSALEMFTRPRVTLGSDVGLGLGPLINTGGAENDIRWKELNNTVLTYLKAKGQHRAAQLDGSLVTERSNENERFYASTVDVLDILAGNVRKSIPEIDPLFEAIKAAEGRTDYDVATMDLLSQQPAPGDAIIESDNISSASPRPSFGVPNAEDPDPFGVIALEMAGLEIREAGTKMRPTSTQFEYSPSPTSPVHGAFNRQSIDTYLTRSNRGSYMSTRTQATTMTDAGTQTDVVQTPDTTLSPNQSDDGKDQVAADDMLLTKEPEEVDYTKVDMSVISHLGQKSLDNTPTAATMATQTPEQPKQVKSSVNVDKIDAVAEAKPALPKDERDEDADDEDEEDEEDEPVIFEVATTTQPTRATIMSSQVTQVIQAKGSLVTIPKRIPPPLPVRSPARTSRASKSDYGDVSMLKSPLRESFQSGLAESVTSEAKEETSPLNDVTNASEELTKKLEGLATESSKDGGHHRHSSSIYSPVESRSSMQSTPDVIPAARTADMTSSADESDHGPKTPRPEDDFQQNKMDVDGELEKGQEMRMEPTHVERTAIRVV